jgi:hypothetical protein
VRRLLSLLTLAPCLFLMDNAADSAEICPNGVSQHPMIIEVVDTH